MDLNQFGPRENYRAYRGPAVGLCHLRDHLAP